LFFTETMSSSLEHLVPVLDGTNYRNWAVMMQSFLQMQEIWEVVDGAHRMPAALDPSATAAQTAAYNVAYTAWNSADNKAIGAITLRITPSLRHYRAANQTACIFWANLKTAFGAPSMSSIYSDFKAVINTKLSGGNPIPKMECIATLFNRLVANNFTIAANLQGLILLAALPSKWDSVAQLFMQHDNIGTQLTFPNVRTAITHEYECSNRPVDSSARKLSAVKRKGPDPSYCPQQQQPGPSRQPQGHPQQQQQSAHPKRRGGHQEKEKKERHARKTAEHNHSHFASTSMISEVEPQLAPIWINALQPLRTAPLHSSVASFGKNGIEYRNVSLVAPKPTPTASVCVRATVGSEVEASRKYKIAGSRN
jgi:hypothetical protein